MSALVRPFKRRAAKANACDYPDLMAVCGNHVRQAGTGHIGWTHLAYEPGDELELAAVGLTLPLAALYEGNDLPS